MALTAPYMHDGRFATLNELVEPYDYGVERSATLDPNLAKHPAGGIQLSAEDKRALVAFLETLTDETFAQREIARLSNGIDTAAPMCTIRGRESPPGN